MNLFLPDGPLAAARAAREATVHAMAADLIRFESFHTTSDAVRSLMGHYKAMEIALYADDARQVAMQGVVAREMMKP
jgi:hypothetical protein